MQLLGWPEPSQLTRKSNLDDVNCQEKAGDMACVYVKMTCHCRLVIMLSFFGPQVNHIRYKSDIPEYVELGSIDACSERKRSQMPQKCPNYIIED